jgi:two-component system phosphate regulon sensor histidine kinase PhoR
MMKKSSINKLIADLPQPLIDHIKYLERMRQDFVANVSHELRTPLTVIHGYLETLLTQENNDTKPWKKIFFQMQQQTLRMENLVEDLLLLSRLEEDETNISLLTAVDPLLQIIVQEANVLSGEAHHSIELHSDPTLSLIGSLDELRSLFSNIIFNAVKYTPPHGHIIIEWSHRNKQAFFSVRDTGIGIAAEHIPRLTERFYRVDKGRSRESGGTGLGLAIAKHVLIRHQGKLIINSEIGKGSVFSCVFPKERMILNRP